MTTGGSGPLVGLGAISSVTVQTMPISLSVGLDTITAVTVRTIPISLSDGEIRKWVFGKSLSEKFGPPAH